MTKDTFYSPEIVRVVKVPAGQPGNTRESLVVPMEPQDVKVQKSENSSAVTLKSPVLTVKIDKKTGLVQFLAKNKNLLKEKSFGFEERTSGPDAGSFRTTIVYQLDADEPIYGIGVTQEVQATTSSRTTLRTIRMSSSPSRAGVFSGTTTHVQTSMTTKKA